MLHINYEIRTNLYIRTDSEDIVEQISNIVRQAYERYILLEYTEQYNNRLNVWDIKLVFDCQRQRDSYAGKIEALKVETD